MSTEPVGRPMTANSPSPTSGSSPETIPEAEYAPTPENEGREKARRTNTSKAVHVTLLTLSILFFLSGLFMWGMVVWPLFTKPEPLDVKGNGPGKRDRPQFDPDEFAPVTVIPKPFRPISTSGFTVKSVDEADETLRPNELVLGVQVGKEARAYPINMLTGPSREILNDELGGRAIAATW